MNEKHDFALVPSPPGAVEKTEPGAKRILSGMVADTLALVKKERPLRVVIVDDEDDRLVTMKFLILYYFKNVTVETFQYAELAWQELSRTDPDLLVTDDIMGELNGEEIVHRLAARRVAYPIIVISGLDGPETEQWVSRYSGRGLNVTLVQILSPAYNQNLWKALESSLKMPRRAAGKVDFAAQPRRTCPPRVVILYDEDGPRQSLKVLLRNRHYFKQATFLEIANGDEAWEELLRADPDLFITDLKHQGLDGVALLERLAEKQAKFPVYLICASWTADTEKRVNQCARVGLKVTHYLKPLTLVTLEMFLLDLIIHFGPLDNPQPQAGLKTPQDSTIPPEITTQRRKTRLLRIIVVDDVEGPRRLLEITIKVRYPDARILLFDDGEKAMTELLREDPDLLVTDLNRSGLNGVEMLHLLAERKANYPILVSSATISEERAKQLVRLQLNLHLIHKPFILEDLQRYLSVYLGPGDNPQPQAGLKTPHETTPPAEVTSHPAITRPLRIVMVDDEAGQLEWRVKLLREWFDRVEVVTFTSAQPALAELELRTPDLLITDDRMAVMTGLELVCHLAVKKVKYPIVMLSAYQTAQVLRIVKKLNEGGLNILFVEVPVEPASLRLLLEDMLREKPDVL